MARGTGSDSVEVDGRHVRFTHPDKVLYTETGTTKSDVLEYFLAVAPYLQRHAGRRPVTRKRWPDGTAEKSFFEKKLPRHAPDWVTRATMEHSTRTIDYPVLDSSATLAWFAQMAALELHVPQWTLKSGRPGRTGRIVIDLDPGERVDLDDTAQVALRVRDLLADAGLDSLPVTSGSKGIHLYARLGREVSTESATKIARQVAKSLEAQSPELVTATMSKTSRRGKVFLDWSQNSASKTTIAPYSLRGRAEPWVAAPRRWEELGDGSLTQLHWNDVLNRLDGEGDLLAGLDVPGDDEGVAGNLAEYRRKRGRHRTPEPFGDGDDARGRGVRTDGGAPVFVIQEHHARSLHFDLRLERDGVLASWAIPKNLPTRPRRRRLAVRTEDHPLDYADFEGAIPRGEYGAGDVTIWDRGTYECEKWDDDEIIVRLDGEELSGRYVLVRTDTEKDHWIAQYMLDQSGQFDQPETPLPMLPTSATVTSLSDRDWAFEGKWDGYRVITTCSEGGTHVASRNGNELRWLNGAFTDLADAIAVSAILDGEAVAVDDAGGPDFAALVSLAGAEGSEGSKHGDGSTGRLRLFVFDVLELDGVDLRDEPWERRRETLDLLRPRFEASGRVVVPDLISGPGDTALAHAATFGWEGVVAKRRDSRYETGRRSRSWLKEKLLTTTDAVVGGWRPGKGGLSDSFGSLLLGTPTDTGLEYIGRVGTGFSDRQRREILDELTPLRRKTSPFLPAMPAEARRDAHWVRPQLVAEVRHQGRTEAGLLRQPVWRAIRRDKLPGDL